MEKQKASSAEVIESKIESLLAEMTLDEKIGLLHGSSSFTSGGVPRLGIPELTFSDGPHGVRHEHGRGWHALNNSDDRSTYLPVGICLASTWNEELGYRYGEVLGNEAKHRGKNVLLGPGINIIRSPLNGRNFEYLSEDPFLTGALAVGYIKGVQEQGIAACPKHYAANNQETDRHTIDVMVSLRALHEIYLPAFRRAVQDGRAWCIMGAYNKVNGQFATHHAYLNSKILKGEWNFDGVVLSDWASVKDTREALVYGTDIEMGTELTRDFENPVYDDFFLARPAQKMIESGKVDVRYVDDKVRRILRLMHRTTALTDHSAGRRNTEEHRQVALDTAREGIVLLKNDGLLPLDEPDIKTIAVIGHNATRLFAERGGSSQVRPPYEISVLEGIRKKAGNEVEVHYAEGYEPYYDESHFADTTIDAAAQSGKVAKGLKLPRSANKNLMKEAEELAKRADVVIFVGGWIHGHDNMPWGEGTYDSEARDKLNLKLIFEQETLIKKITAINKNTAVVLMGGSQVEMKNWLPDTRAYLHAWYPGQEGGTAIAEILFGKTNPSGKLPVTFTDSHLEYPSHSIGEFPGKKKVRYKEDIFVGYRYFDTREKDVTFPFGFGLSYTTFALSDLKLEVNNNLVRVQATVKNTGDREGAEVVQVYVHPRNPSVKRPHRELKSFKKVHLGAGESADTEFVLDKSAFSYFSEEKHEWVFDPGDYEIQVGTSSRDIRLVGDVVV